MAQIKIYGIRERLVPIREKLSEVIHSCAIEVLQLPADKRAHRFFPMDREDYLYPGGRTDAYIIIEIAMIEGRTVETRKKLVKRLFEAIHTELEISYQDIEILIQESPAHNWGFRGMNGDEIKLNYKIEI